MNLIIRCSQNMILLERAPKSMVHTMSLKPNMTSISPSSKSKFLLNQTTLSSLKSNSFLLGLNQMLFSSLPELIARRIPIHLFQENDFFGFRPLGHTTPFGQSNYIYWIPKLTLIIHTFYVKLTPNIYKHVFWARHFRVGIWERRFSYVLF